MLFFSSINLKKHACKIRIGELEMSLIIEFQECRTVRVIILEVQIVHFRFSGGMTTILTNVNLEKDIIIA